MIFYEENIHVPWKIFFGAVPTLKTEKGFLIKNIISCGAGKSKQ
jgi:hypothetical protein